ncbi:MAG: cupin domain-containing protein [Actinobacteria bacterium]|nr:MAG: cupin domain-containing protein [Actinomycetota bacterium]
MTEPFNVYGDDWESEEQRPGYRRRGTAIGPRFGAQKLGMSLYELPPGEKSFPYHYEIGCEEWLIVVAGRPTLRDPSGERALEAGELVCFPDGPAGAHQVRNDTAEPVRVLILSNKPPVALARYPDSKKVMLWTQAEGPSVVKDEPVDYWLDE